MSKKNKKSKRALGLKRVKDTYKDVDDYLATFEPLLFEEVKAQIVKGRDEEDGISFLILHLSNVHPGSNRFSLPRV